MFYVNLNKKLVKVLELSSVTPLSLFADYLYKLHGGQNWVFQQAR